MVIKIKDFFGKTRHVKNNDNPKYTSYEDKEIRDIMKKNFSNKKKSLYV